MEKLTDPNWWLKEDEPESCVGSMILGGIFGFLIGIVVLVSFSYMLVESVGIIGIYIMAFCFVILGAGFGWAFKQKGPKDTLSSRG